MLELIESVKKHGVLVPAIARPKPDGSYDFDKKNALDIERFLSHRLRLKPDTVCEVFEADPSGSLPDKQ